MLYSEELGRSGAEIEAMIAAIPTVSHLEEAAAAAGLVNVEANTATEVFEFENGGRIYQFAARRRLSSARVA